MSLITVRHERGLAFRAAVRGHAVTVDMWGDPGFTDAGPSPVELFVMALGTCMGMHVALFCERAGCSADGLGVDLTFGLAREGDLRRVSSVYAEVKVPGLPAALAAEAEQAARDGVLPVSLSHALEVEILVRTGDREAP